MWGPVSLVKKWRSVETFLELRYHVEISGDGGGFITSHRGCVFASHHWIYSMTPGDISSCFCVEQNKLFPWSWHQNRYFEPNRDIFLTLTKWFVTGERKLDQNKQHIFWTYLVFYITIHTSLACSDFWLLVPHGFVLLSCYCRSMQTFLKIPFKSKAEVDWDRNVYQSNANFVIQSVLTWQHFKIIGF